MKDIVKSLDEPEADRDDSGSPGALSEEFLDETKPPSSKGVGESVTVRDPDGSERSVELQVGESAQTLPTGDTLVTSLSADILLMPDGGRLAFSLDGEVSDDGALAELDRRLVIQDKEGRAVAVSYGTTLTSMPPVDVYNLSDGGEVRVKSGIAEIKLASGAVVYMDGLGVFAVKRGDRETLVREPEVEEELLDADDDSQVERSL